MRSLALLWLAMMALICLLIALGVLLPAHPAAVAFATFITLFAWGSLDEGLLGRSNSKRRNGRTMVDFK